MGEGSRDSGGLVFTNPDGGGVWPTRLSRRVPRSYT